MGNSKINLDKVGITASVLCAIHCAFLPVLITVLPLLGIGFLVKGWVENLMVLLSILIAGTSLGLSFKLHQKLLPLVLLIIGLTVIAIVHLFLPENLEPFMLPFGGLMIATAHYFNWTYSGKCAVNHSDTTKFNKSSE
jgi:hypothetical protein